MVLSHPGSKNSAARGRNLSKKSVPSMKKTNYTSFPDPKIQDLLVDSLKLRGSYLVAGELASVYVDISKKHIMPGVSAVERLGLSTDKNSDMTPAQKSSQILLHARKAQSEISARAEEVRVISLFFCFVFSYGDKKGGGGKRAERTRIKYTGSGLTKVTQRRKKLRDELYIHDREISEIGLLVENAPLDGDEGEDSSYVNEWEEA